MIKSHFTLLLFLAYFWANIALGQTKPKDYTELELNFDKSINNHSGNINAYSGAKNKTAFWNNATFSLSDTSEYRAIFISNYAALFRKYIEYHSYKPAKKDAGGTMKKENKKNEVCAYANYIFESVRLLSSSRHPKKILSFKYLKTKYFDTIANPSMVLLDKVLDTCKCQQQREMIREMVALQPSSFLKIKPLKEYDDSHEGNILQPYSKLINKQIKLITDSASTFEVFKGNLSEYTRTYRIPKEDSRRGYKVKDKFAALYHLVQFFDEYIRGGGKVSAVNHFQRAFQDVQKVFGNEHPAYRARRKDYKRIGLTPTFMNALKDSLSSEVSVSVSNTERILPNISFPIYRDTAQIRVQDVRLMNTLNNIKINVWKSLSELMTKEYASFFEFYRNLEALKLSNIVNQLDRELIGQNNVRAFTALCNFYNTYLKDEKIDCAIILSFAQEYRLYKENDSTAGLQKYQAVFSTREVKDIFEEVTREDGYCFKDKDIKRERNTLLEKLEEIEKKDAQAKKETPPPISDMQILPMLHRIAKGINEDRLPYLLRYLWDNRKGSVKGYTYNEGDDTGFRGKSDAGVEITGELLPDGNINFNLINTYGGNTISIVLSPDNKIIRITTTLQNDKLDITASSGKAGEAKIFYGDRSEPREEFSGNAGFNTLFKEIIEDSIKAKKLFPYLQIRKCMGNDYHCNYCNYKNVDSYIVTFLAKEKSININDLGRTFFFRAGRYYIDYESEHKILYRNALQDFANLTKILYEYINPTNFTLCFQGEADISGDKTFRGTLKGIHKDYLSVVIDSVDLVNRKIVKITLNEGKNKISTDLIFRNKHLPDLRAIFFKEYVMGILYGDNQDMRVDLQDKEVIKVVKGRVTDALTAKDRNCTIVICVDWDKANKDFCVKYPELCRN